MNDLNRPDLEGRLRDHYRTLEVGSSRELASRVAEAMDRAPSRRWPALRLSPRRAAVGGLGLAVLAVMAIVASPLWFGQTTPAGPATANPTATASATPSSGPQATSSPAPYWPDPSAVLASSRASALGRMGLGGAWAIQGSYLCLIPDASNESCNSTWPASDTEPPAVFVLDETHAWTITLTPGSVNEGQGRPYDHLNIVVNRTADGGLNWKQANVPGDYTFSQFGISFVDPLHGYLIASPREFSSVATVLSTQDGGATWTVVARVSTANGPLGAQLTASDATTLWAGAQVEAKISHPLLAVSRDGGKSWSEVTLPGLAGAWGGDGGETYGPPVFVNPSTGFVTVQVAPDTPTVPTDTEVFGTTDGGRTWARKTMPAGFPSNGSAGPAWSGVDDFIDATHWVVAQGSTLYATADGGKTWQSSASEDLPAGAFVRIVCIEPSTIVATYRPDGAADNYLYRTSNGGITWELASTGQG
jgi:photosystem II stability/assembly factor-like uncharacterized protein